MGRKKVDVPANTLAGMEDEDLAEIQAADLTPRHQLFVAAFLRHGNASRAVREAGYATSPANYARHGHELLVHPKIAPIVAERRRARLERFAVSKERIEDELAKIAFANIAHFMDAGGRLDLSEVDETDLAALAELTVDTIEGGEDKPDIVRVKGKLHSKQAALDSLAKIHRMYGADLSATLTIDLADRIREGRARARIAPAGTDGEGDGSGPDTAEAD